MLHALKIRGIFAVLVDPEVLLEPLRLLVYNISVKRSEFTNSQPAFVDYIRLGYKDYPRFDDPRCTTSYREEMEK